MTRPSTGHVPPKRPRIDEPAVLAAAATLIGLIAFAGWVWDVEALKSVLPGLVAMKVNTSVGIVLSGAALWLLARPDAHATLHWPGRGAAGLVLLLGVFTLSQDVFGWDLGMDQLIFQEPAHAAHTASPGRMSWITAVQFICVAGALSLLGSRRASGAVQGLALLAGGLSLSGAARYMLGEPGLLLGVSTPAALHTVIAFLALASGVLAATRDRGFVAKARPYLPRIGASIALVMILVGWVGLLHNARLARDTSNWVEHTQRVKRHVEAARTSLQHLGASTRGFILTGDPGLLSAARQARESLSSELSNLTRLTEGDPDQQTRLAGLRRLVSRRIQIADESMRLRRETGLGAAIAYLAGGTAERSVSEIDAGLAEMGRAETEQLGKQRAAAEVAASGSTVSSAFLGCLSLVLLLSMFASSRRSNTVLEQRVLERTRELSRSNRALRMLSDCNQNLVRATDEARLTQSVCDLVVRDGGYRYGLVLYAEQDEARTLRTVARAGAGVEQLPIASTWTDVDGAQTASGLAIRTGRPAVLNELQDDPKLVGWRDAIRSAGVRSAAALPLDVEGRVLGALVVLSAEPAAFDENEVAILDELAKDLSFGIATLRNRAAKRASDERLRLVLDLADVVVWAARPDASEILEATASFERVYGRSVAELRGNPGLWLEVVHPDDRGIAEQSGLDLLTKDHSRATYRIVRPDGSVRWLLESKAAVRDGDGKVLQIGGAAQDITERVEAEQAALRHADRTTALFAIAPDGILVVDREGRIVECNPRAGEIFGWPCDELRGSLVETLLPARAAEHHAQLRSAYASDPVRRAMSAGRELLGRRRDGTEFPVEVSLSPFDPEGGGRVLAIARDITERKRAEGDRIARAAAESANRAKSAFLANMSHEIRTPMNAVLGFTQLLLRDPATTAAQRQHLETITRAGEHLLSLIDSILQLARIEAGRVFLDETTFDAAALADDLEQLFRYRADRKGLRLLVEMRPDVPRYIRADEPKLRQVLCNLVGNACKFTERGGVAVRFDVRGDPAERRLVVEVEDSGCGIAPSELPRLFQKFEQTESGRRSREGTGLGLAISQELVDLMGGSIAVESRPGEGSIFRVEFPLEEGEESDVAPKETVRRVVRLSPGQPPCRVLVVDDKEDNRAFAAGLLDAVGFETSQAEGGEEALRVLPRFEPHVVLMDMRMPGIGGAEAIRRIRAAGDAVKIIALTASAFEEDRRAAREVGADAYMSKPFREEVLFDRIQQLVGVRYDYAEPAEATFTGLRQGAMASTVRLDVTRLPQELRGALRLASLRADLDALRGLLEQARSHDEGAATKLRELAERYAYKEIVELLSLPNGEES